MKDVLRGVEKLTPADVLDGALLFLGHRKFPEQAVYALFQEIEAHRLQMRGWFEITGTQGDLRSEPLRGLLNFMESGKVLEIAPPNPVDQFYNLRDEQRPVVRQDLKDRGLLPKYQRLFEYLAERLARLSRQKPTIALCVKEA